MTKAKKAKLLRRRKAKIKKLNMQRNSPLKTKELKKKLAKLKTFKRPDIFGIKERILNR